MHFQKHFWPSALRWGTATRGGVFGQGEAWPWTRVCLSQGKSARTTTHPTPTMDSKQGAEQHVQWSLRMCEVCVVGAMRTHAVNQMPSAVIMLSLMAWAHACRATVSP